MSLDFGSIFDANGSVVSAGGVLVVQQTYDCRRFKKNLNFTNGLYKIIKIKNYNTTDDKNKEQ